MIYCDKSLCLACMRTQLLISFQKDSPIVECAHEWPNLCSQFMRNAEDRREVHENRSWLADAYSPSFMSISVFVRVYSSLSSAAMNKAGQTKFIVFRCYVFPLYRPIGHPFESNSMNWSLKGGLKWKFYCSKWIALLNDEISFLHFFSISFRFEVTQQFR